MKRLSSDRATSTDGILSRQTCARGQLSRKWAGRRRASVGFEHRPQNGGHSCAAGSQVRRTAALALRRDGGAAAETAGPLRVSDAVPEVTDTVHNDSNGPDRDHMAETLRKVALLSVRECKFDRRVSRLLVGRLGNRLWSSHGCCPSDSTSMC